MNVKKIFIVLKREYIERVKKKSFIILTLLSPILFSLIIFVPVYIKVVIESEEKVIAVVDSSKLFYDLLPETKDIKFKYLRDKTFFEAEQEMVKEGYYAVLFIPNNVLSIPTVTLSSLKSPSINVKLHIINSLKTQIEALKLIKNNVDPSIIYAVKTNVNVNVVKINERGERKTISSDLRLVVSVISAILIYIFIFMYAGMVFKGVLEEKTNRIVEIIASCIKPFHWMMGKILGIGLVAITQFFAWIIITLLISFIIGMSLSKTYLMESLIQNNQQLIPFNILQQSQLNFSEILKYFNKIVSLINFKVIFFTFIIFFVFGYFMYSAIFAAIGSMVETDSDAQQFTLPITLPLLVTILLLSTIISNPDSPISVFLSILPLTSPVVMLIRIAYGVPIIEFIISVLFLIAAFILFTYFSGKVFRTSLLIFGKKITYKDILIWLKS